MSYSDFLEKSLMDMAFGGVTFTPSSILYVALSSGNPGENLQTFVEPAVGGYARVGVDNNKTTFSNAINSVNSGVIHNMISIEFPRATDFVGLVTHFVLLDQDVGGHSYGYGVLSNARTIYSGDTPNFASGTMTITMD